MREGVLKKKSVSKKLAKIFEPHCYHSGKCAERRALLRTKFKASQRWRFSWQGRSFLVLIHIDSKIDKYYYSINNAEMQSGRSYQTTIKIILKWL